MMDKRRFFSYFLALFAVAVMHGGILGTSQPVQAQEARITDIVIANSATELLLYLTVVHAFTPEMETGVKRERKSP